MADSTRQRKVADRIVKTVAQTLERRIKDPRLGFVTITDCKVTGDLQQATVFYTVMGSDAQKKLTAKALQSAKGIIRSEVGRALGIRLTPQLFFELDHLQESALSFEQALAKARESDRLLAQQAAGASYAGEANPYREESEEGGSFEDILDAPTLRPFDVDEDANGPEDTDADGADGNDDADAVKPWPSI